MMLFACCFFFFANMRMFLNDITSYMAFAPILFLLGVIFVCFYITMLVFYLFEAETVWVADRFDLVYKIVFSLTLMLLIIRSFFGDFMGSGTILNVPVAIIVISIVSGVMTWCIPKIRDNDNLEF